MFVCLLMLALAGGVLAQNEPYLGAYEVRWSPDGRWIGVGSTNGIWIFDVGDADAEPYHYAGVEEGRNLVYIAEFDPVRQNVAFAPEDETQTYVIEIETGAEVYRADTLLDGDDPFPVYYDLRYSVDGLLLSVLNGSQLFVVDAASGDRISGFSSPFAEPYAGSNWLTTLDYGNDNATIIVGDWSANLFVYAPGTRNLKQENALDINDGVGYRLERFEIIPGTDEMVVLGWSELYVYDLAADVLKPIGALEDLRVRGFDLSPDGRQMAVGAGTSWYLYDLVSEQIVGEFESDFREESDRNQIYSLAFSPTAERVAALQTDGQLKIWDVATGEVVAQLGEFTSGVSQKWG